MSEAKWQPLVVAVARDPQAAAAFGDPKIWMNDLWQVIERDVPVEDWPGGMVTWLSIRRLDRSADHDWRALQRIKNQLCGPHREGIEVYPDEDRLVDTSNQYHLFVLAEGFHLPFGFAQRRVVDADGYDAASNTAQRGFHIDDRPQDALTAEEAAAQVQRETGKTIRQLSGAEPREGKNAQW
jgi:hypothetical protein